MNHVVMAVRNGFQMTLAAVESVMAQDCGHVRLIIIDNGTDGTGYKVQQWDPAWKNKIWVVADSPTQPWSVAESWNRGLRMAFADIDTNDPQSSVFAQLTPAKLNQPVLVCNNDIVLKPETFRVLSMLGLPFVTPCGVATMEEFAAMPIDLNHRSRHCDFSAFMIRRWVFEKVQFDENCRGAYCEDLLFHMDLHRAGIEGVKVNVPFYNTVSGTLKVNPQLRAEIFENAAHNRRYFESKWGFPPPPNDGGKYEAFFAEQPCKA